ncbi:MAG: imelysin family protein, partial [Polyangiaceae bacterium]
MKQGSYPSWLGASLCASVLLGCGNTGAPPLTYEVDGKPVLTTLTEQVIVPEHQAFASAGDALVVAVQALADGPNAASLARAQTAWRDARKAYRHLDALHFGPGYSLHIGERIDVAPVDAAGVDALINGGAAVDDAAVANAAGKRKGFLGLEYLLFAAPEASDSDPVLVDDAAAPRRRALALSMADEIAKSAHQLDEAWDPDQGGFVTQLQLAGAGSTAYPTQRAAVDALVGGIDDALEIVVGRRLAPPLGNQTGGGGVPAPDLDPTRRSDSAVADLQASLEGAL